MAFQPYKIEEYFKLKHYLKIPKELFLHPLYKNNLTIESILVYGFLLDRLGLSIQNRWVDKNDAVYVIFTRKELQNLLDLSDKTITKAFKELQKCELIKEEKQQCSKLNMIYVGKVQTLSNKVPQNRKNYDSGHGNSTTLESENLRPINTNNSKTNINKSNSLKFDNRYKDNSGQYDYLDSFYSI